MRPRQAVKMILRSVGDVKEKPIGGSVVFPGYYRLIRRQLTTGSELPATLAKLRPYFRGWQKDFSNFLRRILDAGYSVKSLNDYVDEDLDKPIVFLRYDVHPYDILSAVGIAEAHAKYKVPGLFYINWDFSPLETGLRDQYLFLRRFDSDYVHFGLHAAPSTSWLIFDRFEGNRANAAKFIRSGDFKTYLDDLLAEHDRCGYSGERLAGMVTEIEGRFSQIATSFREAFPTARTVTAHGNVLNTTLNKLCRREPRYGALIDVFESRAFLTRERYERFGFFREMSLFPKCPVGGTYLLHDGRVDDFKRRFKAHTQAQIAMVLLFHPHRWANGHFASLVRSNAGAPRVTGHAMRLLRQTALHLLPASRIDKSGSSPSAGGDLSDSDKNSFDLDSMIFIAGFARGGTTWLRRCIGAHPDITEIPGETVFARERPLTVAAIRRLLLEKIKADDLTSCRFVTKGPVNSLVFAEMAKLLPNAKHIYIIRDPRDVFVSHKRGAREWMKGKNSTVEGCMAKTQRYHDAYLEAEALPNVLTVRYEDLHQNFPAAYRRICRFLGVSDDDRVIADCLAKTSFSNLTGRDHAEDPQAGARKGVIGEWATHLTPEDVMWYQGESYWPNFLEKYRYDWRVRTVDGVVKALAESGLGGTAWADGDAEGPGRRSCGVRVLHVLEGLGPDAPIGQAIEAGKTTRSAALPLCYGLPVAIGDNVDQNELANLQANLSRLRTAVPEAALALYIGCMTIRNTLEELISHTTGLVESLRASQVEELLPDFILVDSDGPVDREAAKDFADRLSQRCGLPLQWFGGPEGIADGSARIEVRNGIIRLTGLPAGFDVLDAGAYGALPPMLLTLVTRPLLQAFSAPLDLGFRDDLGPV